jgi:hypothetical protein
MYHKEPQERFRRLLDIMKVFYNPVIQSSGDKNIENTEEVIPGKTLQNSQNCEIHKRGELHAIRPRVLPNAKTAGKISMTISAFVNGH